MDGERLPIGQKEIARAWEELTRYKQGKQALEERIVQDEQWWKGRHWDVVGRREGRPEPVMFTMVWHMPSRL